MLSFFLSVIYMFSVKTGFATFQQKEVQCIWNQQEQTCTFDPTTLISVFNSSHHPYIQYLTCELISNQDKCNQQNRGKISVCQWDQSNKICGINQSSLTQDLMECVDNNCQNNLQYLNQNLNQSVAIHKTPNCSFSSFTEADANNQFCETVKARASYFGVADMPNFSDYSYCSSGEQLSEMSKPTKVDSLIASIMNLKCRESGGQNFESPARTAMLDAADLDVILGLERGTLESYYACQDLRSENQCNKQSAATYQSQSSTQENKIQARRSDDTLTTDPGSFVYLISVGLFIFGVFLWFLRFHLFICIQQSLRQHEQQQRNNLDTQKILTQLQKYKFQFTQQDQNEVLNRLDICSICHDNYTEQDEGTKLKCGHVYHTQCIERWVVTKGRESTCPLCGYQLYEVQNSQNSNNDVRNDQNNNNNFIEVV
eukprot:TRINITY_DN179_c0_g2_i1.p1 TRINITY_DN179_c0_g2~~TRINITY_DN179_c0_g2_i1.p1  ORF type:complete len:428 (-),score=26.88 TRINITY_DN179_c0_g2_i1:3213-4496(-)